MNQHIQIKDKKIKIIYDCIKLLSIWAIQVFLGFANFYQRFIYEFSRLATPFILIFSTNSVKILGTKDTE